MLDISLIRESPDLVRESMRKRHMDAAVVDEVKVLDEQWRDVLTEGNRLRHRKNVLADEIKELRKQGKDISEKIEESKVLPQKIRDLEEKERNLRSQIQQLMLQIPNLLHESVPLGLDDTENEEVRRWGTFREYDFELKSHVDVMEALNLLDTERAGKVAGSRFFYLKNEAVLLDMALIHVALQHMRTKGKHRTC
jgi:seryl-tRNA synthetase